MRNNRALVAKNVASKLVKKPIDFWLRKGRLAGSQSLPRTNYKKGRRSKVLQISPRRRPKVILFFDICKMRTRDPELGLFLGTNCPQVEKYWFSVVDIVQVLTDSVDARTYWKVLKTRLKKEGNESVTNCNQLKLLSSDGKRYKTDVADLQGIFRIIQSIPSKKAEPVKQWLAELGERLMTHHRKNCRSIIPIRTIINKIPSLGCPR